MFQVHAIRHEASSLFDSHLRFIFTFTFTTYYLSTINSSPLLHRRGMTSSLHPP